MYALKVSINGREPVTGGATDLCVLSAILSLTGKLGPEAAPRRDGGSVDIDLRLGGLTARAKGAADEHLEWLRANLQAGDVVSIRVVETDLADPVISGHEVERIADDERAYFEHCKRAYLRCVRSTSRPLELSEYELPLCQLPSPASSGRSTRVQKSEADI